MVFRVNMIRPAITLLLRFGTARVLGPLAAEEIAPAIGPAGPDELRQGLRQCSEALLALAQRSLRGCSLADIGRYPNRRVDPARAIQQAALHGEIRMQPI